MFDNQQRAFVAINDEMEICFFPKMANRHGLITGATGTGKTITLQNLTETFSDMGVPVFAADIKGDLSGLAKVGGNKSSVTKRVDAYQLKEKGFEYKNYPIEFWDVFGKKGIPIRTTITELGPLLLERLLDLNSTQGAILTMAFKIADENNLLLIDLKDLQKLLQFIGDNRKDFITQYGNISTASIGAIQRSLIRLESQGGEYFFEEPNLNINDFIRTNAQGKGIVNVLAADDLMNAPKVYTTMLLWLLSELYEELPEVGDLERPKLVFFFDEAHLLFSDMPKELLERVEQIVRLVRSKGVGIYFVTQNPADIPESILGQLGNRVQHALRAYTPNDQKAVRVAANTFRANPKFDTAEAITQLGIGEGLISFLDTKGAPQIVQRAFILPPSAQVGPINQAEREQKIKASTFYGKYTQTIDRTSAYEILSQKEQTEKQQIEKATQKMTEDNSKQKTGFWETALQDIFKQIGRNLKRQAGNEITKIIKRSILGTPKRR